MIDFIKKLLGRHPQKNDAPAPEVSMPTDMPTIAPPPQTATRKSKQKRKTLPKEFADLLEKGDLEELQKVFEQCALDARGGYGKQTALAFTECPDALAEWLVAQGADLQATDTSGNTPLHSRARSWKGRIDILLDLGADIESDSASIGTPLHAAAHSHRAENARLLLERGARVDPHNSEGLTPLELGLRSCSNIDLEEMVSLAEVLLGAGAEKTPRMKELVASIGQRFEFHRSAYNPKHVDAASDALLKLYALFDVPPVPRRKLHDDTAKILVESTQWQKQHEELWELLVPSRGPAATVQGEVIRISGRIAHELDGNGGINWDADFKQMARAILGHFHEGNPLPPAELAEASAIIVEINRTSGDMHRLCELAVMWVLLNPIPAKLESPSSYKR